MKATLPLNAPITTTADDSLMLSFFISCLFHVNCLQADDSQEISGHFFKHRQNLKMVSAANFWWLFRVRYM